MISNNITVIVSTRNRKYEVKRALDSVYAQTVQPMEVILVDDGSEDGTEGYIKGFAYKGLRYIMNPFKEKHSVGHSRNLGINNAKGEYIAFLDSDNIWYPDKLEVFTDRIRQSEEVIDVAYSHYKKHIKFRTIELPMKLPNICTDKKEENLRYSLANASAAVYRKAYLQEIGLFNEDMMTNTDWELLLRGIHMQDTAIMEIDKVLSENWTMHDGVTEQKETEVKERLQLFTKYMDQMETMDIAKNLYEAYFKYPDTRMSESELNNALAHIYQINPEWIAGLLTVQCADIDNCRMQVQRKNSFYQLIYNWMQLKLNNDSIENRLLTMGCKAIAIYGAGKHGQLLYQELRQSRISVNCFIDQQKKETVGGMPVYTLQEKLPTVDAVIITPYLDFKAIQAKLQERTDGKLILLNKLVSPDKNQWHSYF